MRGLACCCCEFSKLYKYFYFRQIWLREEKIEKKKDMHRITYYIRSFIDLNSNLEGTQNILIISCRFTNKLANLGSFILTRNFLFLLVEKCGPSDAMFSQTGFFSLPCQNITSFFLTNKLLSKPL